MKITSKQQMKKMLSAGEFGNTIHSWSTYEAMVASGYNGLVYVRSDLWSGIHTRMHEVPIKDILPTLAQHGISPSTCRYYEAPQNHHRGLQGEICRAPEIALTYSFLQKPLADAVKEDGRHAHGSAALTIVNLHLRPESIDWLNHLLDTYDGATIEFTEFKTKQGVMSDFLVVWEVRHF